MTSTTYCEAILEAFKYLLKNHEEVFIIGQGLWSPWYVGNSMKDLDKHFGKKRVIDTPVAENAVTGAAIGASLCGMKPILIHPRMDFMLYAMDPIVNQAAKWSYMFGGEASNPQLTIRAIINRGGEQGAQHSQLLHSWFAHIPGLRVVMPYTASDARDLLISSVLCKDPVIYIDDRWLYDEKENKTEIKILDLKNESPKRLIEGEFMTIVSSSFSTKLAKDAIKKLKVKYPFKTIELIDLRIISPLDTKLIIQSVSKTGRLTVIDGGWRSCGLGTEVISSVIENINPNSLKDRPLNISLKEAPAPATKHLEDNYYIDVNEIIEKLEKSFQFAS